MTVEETDELLAYMEQLTKATAQMEAAVEEWSTREFTGSADEGRIVATVDAVGSLLRLDIGALSKRRLDGVTLGDAVVVAVHAAEAAAASAKDEMMHGLRVGDGPNIGELLSDAERTFKDRAGFPA